MTEKSQPSPIGSAYCPQYNTEAAFFIEDQHPSGLRHLVVRYGNGGHDGRAEFAAAIPPDWTEREISDLILRPIASNSEYPAWEIPARQYRCAKLFRWWAGEKPN